MNWEVESETACKCIESKLKPVSVDVSLEGDVVVHLVFTTRVAVASNFWPCFWPCE